MKRSFTFAKAFDKMPTEMHTSAKVLLVSIGDISGTNLQMLMTVYLLAFDSVFAFLSDFLRSFTFAKAFAKMPYNAHYSNSFLGFLK
jgi:hypothetical protein